MVPLFLFEIRTDEDFDYKRIIKHGFQNLPKYLPAIALALSFLIFHYVEKSWITQHQDSPWSNSFQRVGFSGLLKNVVFFGHRMVDFGMIAIVALMLYHWKFVALLKGRLGWLYLFVLALFAILILPYNGLLNHRYFLPLQIVAILIAGQLLVALDKKWLSYSVIIFLLLGNLWVYPKHIAQGWDSTLGHQSFYALEESFRAYIGKSGLKPNEISTVFPLKANTRFRTLSDAGDQDLLDFHEQEAKYLLYSNIMNDFSDSELEQIEKMQVVKRWRKGIVELILYEQ